MAVPNQVVWRCAEMSYKLIVTGDTMPRLAKNVDLKEKPLTVRRQVSRNDNAAHIAERKKVFKRAVDAWNARDTSSKPRIEIEKYFT